MDYKLPNSLRWFLNQNLYHFAPWFFLDSQSQYQFSTESLGERNPRKGSVYVFAKCRGNGSFAGLEIAGNKITNRVICFQSVSMPNELELNWNVVDAIYEDVFVFVAKQIMPDMQALSFKKDAADL